MGLIDGQDLRLRDVVCAADDQLLAVSRQVDRASQTQLGRAQDIARARRKAPRPDISPRLDRRSILLTHPIGYRARFLDRSITSARMPR